MYLLHLKISLQLHRRINIEIKRHTFLLKIYKVVKINYRASEEVKEKLYKRK